MGPLGFEPATHCLTVERTTITLQNPTEAVASETNG